MKDGTRYDVYLIGMILLGLVIGIVVGFFIENDLVAFIFAVIAFVIALILTIPHHKYLQNKICPKN